MNKTIVLTGIPGTGKTTVCNLVEKLAKQAGLQLNLLNYGTITMEALQKNGRTMERDAVRRAGLDFQLGLQREVAEEISRRMEKLTGLTIIDTHMTIKTPYGYIPGMPSHVMRLLEPKMFILIEASPDEISMRRMKDSNRKRDDAVEEAVKEELAFARLTVGACSVLTGMPVKIVINAEGKQEEAAREILKMIEER